MALIWTLAGILAFCLCGFLVISNDNGSLNYLVFIKSLGKVAWHSLMASSLGSLMGFAWYKAFFAGL